MERINFNDAQQDNIVISTLLNEYQPYGDETVIDIPNENIPNVVMPNGDYFTVIERRGRLYNYKQSINEKDNPYALHSVQDMARDLYKEAYELTAKANLRARIFKYLHILIFIATVVGKVRRAIASIHTNMSTSDYIVAVFGFIIAALLSFNQVVKLSKRGALLKKTATHLKSIARSVNYLLLQNLDSQTMYQKIHKYYHDLDKYDMQLYNNTIGKISLKSNTNITYSSVSSKKTSKKS